MNTPTENKRFVLLHLVKNVEIGGVQRVLLETLAHIDRRLYEPKVLCLENAGGWSAKLDEMGIEFDVFGLDYPWRRLLSRKMFKHLLPLVRRIRAFRPAVLHIHQPKAAMFAVLAGKLARVPCIIIHQHARYKDHYWRNFSPGRLRLEKRVSLLADAMISVSQTVARETHEILHVPRRHITVIPNAGVAPNAPAGPTPPRAPGSPVAVAMGRTVPDKCFEDFIAAIPRVTELFPDAQFWLIGDEQGKESVRPELEAQASQLGLKGRLHFLGYRQDIAHLLAQADVGVLCSRTEGCSNTLLEYLSASVPAVISDIASLTEIVEHEKTALIVPLHDPARLAEAIARLFADRSLARRIAQAGRQQVASYSWADATRAYERLYRSILEAKGYTIKPSA